MQNNRLKSYDLIKNYFEGSEVKTRLWFNTENPLIGNLKPSDLINLEGEGKLIQVINQRLKGEV